MGALDNFLHLFAPLTANCRDFHERWERANSAGHDGMTGCWEGEWISTATGHRGRLRCVIDAADAARWRMYFRGDYALVFRACYATEFAAAQSGDRWNFAGGSDLGALAGGRYSYAGFATPGEFTCTYRSARDNGEFRLKRYVK